MTDARTPLAGRRSKLLLNAAGLLLVGLVGLAIVWAAARDGGGLTLVFGAAIAGIGLVCAAAALLEWRLHGHRPGPRLGVTPTGEPATVFPRASWATAASAALILVLAASFIAAAAITFARDQAVGGVVLLVIGLAVAAYLVPFLRGLVSPGGVFLSADGVTYARDGSSWHLAWDDVAGVVPREPVAVVVRDGADVRRSKGVLPGWRPLVKAPEDVLGIETRFLTVEPEAVAFVLLAYHDRADLRPQLGTQASLEWDVYRVNG